MSAGTERTQAKHAGARLIIVKTIAVIDATSCTSAVRLSSPSLVLLPVGTHFCFLASRWPDEHGLLESRTIGLGWDVVLPDNNALVALCCEARRDTSPCKSDV